MSLGVPAITEMVLIGVPSGLSTTQKLAFESHNYVLVSHFTGNLDTRTSLFR